MTRFLRAFAVIGLATTLVAAGKAPDFKFAVADEPLPSERVETAGYGLTATHIYHENHSPLQDYARKVWQDAPLAGPETAGTTDAGPDASEIAAISSLSEAVYQLRTNTAAAMDDADMECLATAVYFESKGEPLAGQLAVAQVILNRVESGRFGNSICDVVKAPKQFSFVRNGNLGTPRHARQFETAQAIAWIAANKAWDDVAGRATHFHATYVNPRWKLQRVAAIGNHIFYR